MKNRNYIRTLYFYILLTTVTILTVSSCMYENGQYEVETLTTISDNRALERKKEEAKILVSITELNLKVIALSKVVKDKTSSNIIKNIALEIENKHNLINQDLKIIALKKLISVPDTIFKYNLEKSVKLDDKEFEQTYVENVSRLINKEISYFEELSEKTMDPDFKIFSIHTLVKLKNNIKIVKREKINN